MKVVLILLGVAVLGLLSLMALGYYVGPSKIPTPEAIYRECEAHFGKRGPKAVQDCATALVERAARENEDRALDDVYRAAKRGSD